VPDGEVKRPAIRCVKMERESVPEDTREGKGKKGQGKDPSMDQGGRQNRGGDKGGESEVGSFFGLVESCLEEREKDSPVRGSGGRTPIGRAEKSQRNYHKKKNDGRKSSKNRLDSVKGSKCWA